MSAVGNVKTDPKMAMNGVSYQGYSGILRNQYATIAGAPGAMLLSKKAPAAGLLTYAVTGVIATPDADKWWGQRFVEWVYDRPERRVHEHCTVLVNGRAFEGLDGLATELGPGDELTILPGFAGGAYNQNIK